MQVRWLLFRRASDLLGVAINSYAKIDFVDFVDFVGFQKIIDAIGGIDVTLPEAVNDTVQTFTLNQEINI